MTLVGHLYIVREDDPLVGYLYIVRVDLPIMLCSFARLTLRAREGRLLVVPASLFGGCVRARQGT
jgi:hypothetical protein